ncbi:zinc-finger protein MCG4, variant [Capsaspora owczarzaki ATCC 30864]|uniref:Zinc-finger protein MCG4, variant n=1 Tax=Capsaspora owczarzaki (strain ATCC 30864) TaxID=595528 RepID=A0A0D2X1X0_CAPO3|nr:zinc-finger protein MCG4, variant [Capsaspora owczarzaki ATCC 30864]
MAIDSETLLLFVVIVFVFALQAPIIPPDNAGSLVAQQLRQQLIGSSWARVTSIAPIPPTRHDTSKSVSSPLQTSSLPGLLPATTNGTVASPAHANGTSGGPMASSSSTSLTLSSARRPGGGQDTALLLHDHDDDKYGQRRGLAHLLRQCLGLRSLRRTFVIALAIALVLFVVLGIGSRVLTGPPV